MYNDNRADAVLAGLRTMALDSRDHRLSPTAHRVAGALVSYLGPRMAHDQEIPDLGPVVEGVDRHNLRRSRRMIGDRVRRMVRGKLGRDMDIDDLEALLEAMEDREEESEDHVVEAEPGRGGDPEDVARDPWEEARDRRRLGRDVPPPFEGRPETGGGRMDHLPNEGHNDVRFPEHGEPADARDRLPHRRAADFHRPRRLGADSAPTTGSFARRFAFATRHTVGDDADVRFMRSE